MPLAKSIFPIWCVLANSMHSTKVDMLIRENFIMTTAIIISTMDIKGVHINNIAIMLIIQRFSAKHRACKQTPNREDRFCKRHKYLETKWLQERLDACAEDLKFLCHPCELCNENGHSNLKCKLFHD